MNTVRFNRQGGGLAKKLPGEDHISGLIVYGEANIAKTVLNEVEGLAAIGITPATNPVMHYHVSEYFRINPGSKLYIVSSLLNDGEYAAVKQLQQFAEAKIRQIGVVDLLTVFADLTDTSDTIKVVLNELAGLNMPLELLYSMHGISSANLLALPDLHTLDNERFSVVIGQDAGGRGNYVSGVLTKKVGIIGAALGAVSKAKVHESIAWVEKQNLVTAAYPKALTGGNVLARELDVPAFIDGTLISEFTPGQIQSISNKGYIFMIKHIGYTGTFFNDSFTATDLDSDFATIETNRAMDKAQRGVYIKLLPKVSGPIYVDPASGNLTQDVIASLEAIAAIPLEQMERDGEISGFKININPDQEVLTTSKLEVTIKIVPVGVLRELVVNLGFTLQL